MEAAVVLLAVAVVALAVQLARSEAQLRAIARFLVNRESASNARVALSVRTRGFVQLAQAVNRQIDRHQGERVAAEEAKRELRRGLTYLSHDIRTPLAGAQGYAQLLAAEEHEALRARYLDVVSRRLDDVGGLLDQLYAYAQVQDPDHRIVREPVDVGQVPAAAGAAASGWPSSPSWRAPCASRPPPAWTATCSPWSWRSRSETASSRSPSQHQSRQFCRPSCCMAQCRMTQDDAAG